MNQAISAKEWITEFLSIRGYSYIPVNKPLFSYNVGVDEYKKLEALLQYNKPQICYWVKHSGTYDKYWAACFCLYVSEWYRREYTEWSWSPIESRINKTFGSDQRAELIELGLEKFWKRSIRNRRNGRDFLGSLFVEGGLPWPLVQSETHGFGRAVRQGLRNFYRTKTGLRTTTDLMIEYIDTLPSSFQTLETQQILARVVEQLMYLVEKYQIKDVKNPIEFLDEQGASWRDDFPIPLDEKNAHSLLNEWFRDADKSHQERKKREESESAFSCDHLLTSNPPKLCIRSRLTLPRTVKVTLNHSLVTTRLEFGFYEGNTLKERGGVVYAQTEPDSKSIQLRFPSTIFEIDRKDCQSDITIRLLENGRTVYIFDFNNSALELSNAPLIFEQSGEEWILKAQASYSTKSDKVLIRLPASSTVILGEKNQHICESDGAKWFEIEQKTQIQIGTDLFCVTLNDPNNINLPKLVGRLSLYGTRQYSVFLGFPTLKLSEDTPYCLSKLTHFVDGKRVDHADRVNITGIIRYSVKNSEGETIFYRKIGVLPRNFSLSLFPQISKKPARLMLNNAEDLLVQIVCADLYTEEEVITGGKLLNLHSIGNNIPSFFTLELSGNRCTKPVKLAFPFPYQGATLLDESSGLINNNETTIDQLIGTQISLFSGSVQEQTFFLTLELIKRNVSGQDKRISNQYRLPIAQEGQIINLYSYQDDILQLFGSTPSQDAYVRLTIESSQRLLTLNIRHYSASATKEESLKFSIQQYEGIKKPRSCTAEAMQISDPNRKSIKIPELQSEGVGTGIFDIPHTMNNAVWLIYPTKGSPVQFRPILHVPYIDVAHKPEIKSLHMAAEFFHPQNNADVIDNYIDKMADDFSDSGWQYLSDLKKFYSHIPLSVFETWISVTKNPNCLAAAVLRLDLDEKFCNRIRDELAVTWEIIPLQHWHQYYSQYKKWLENQGLQSFLIERILDNRKNILGSIISRFEDLSGYIESGLARDLKPIPPLEAILKKWYQELRVTHHTERVWPTELTEFLTVWINDQKLPAAITHLSQMHYTSAVTYLPIYMAHITAGRTPLNKAYVDSAFFKFAVRKLADFDRNWYEPVHAMLVTHLLKTGQV